MSVKVKQSLWKKLGNLRRSSVAGKNCSHDSNSTGSSDRLGTYDSNDHHSSVMALRRKSASPVKSTNQYASRYTHTRHASLMPSDPVVISTKPRKVASVPSMPDIDTSKPTTSTSSNKKSAPDNDVRRCSKCPASTSSCSASHSAGNAAVVKPSDRRSQHKFHKLFNLDHNQPLIKSFPCALVGDILFQGTFYASEHFFCFHSKFAKKRKLIQVAIREVTNLTREKTAGIIPNAIAVHTKHTRFMFASIIGRDNIFRLLNNLWDTQLSMNNTMKWVSNDGVIHDSSVDTELDSEDEDEADEEDGGIRLRTLPADERTNSLTVPSPTPTDSPDPASKPGASTRASNTALCSRKTGPTSRTGNHSTGSPSFFSIGRCVREVWSLPRMQICLFIAYIILIFLAFSAIVLAWRVHTYQVFLHDRIERLDHSYFEPNCHSNDAQCNLYRLRQQTHSSRIRHVQAVMNSNIRTLNDLARRLKISEPGQSPPVSSTTEEKTGTPPS